MLDALKAFLNALSDPAALLPDLVQVMEKLANLAKLAVLAGPAVLVLLGLLYFFLAPKEANHQFGFRCWWGMGSVEVWQFTQKLAGIVWGGLGLVLGIVALIRSGSFTAMEPQAMLMAAAGMLLWQIGLVVLSIVAINVVLVVLYDHKGYRRSEKAKAAK